MLELLIYDFIICQRQIGDNTTRGYLFRKTGRDLSLNYCLDKGSFFLILFFINVINVILIICHIPKYQLYKTDALREILGRIKVIGPFQYQIFANDKTKISLIEVFLLQ